MVIGERVARPDDRSQTADASEPEITPRIIGTMAGRIVSPEIVGRGAELEVLARALAQASTGHARVVLVGGEAGIGKTRLVAEAIGLAREASALVLTGGCVGVAEGSLPFAPIVEAVRPLVRALEEDDVRGGSVETDEAALAGAWSPSTRGAIRAVAAAFGLAGVSPSRSMDAAELRPEWARSRLYEALLDLLRRLGEERVVVLVV